MGFAMLAGAIRLLVSVELAFLVVNATFLR